jgi:hypothetical protein
LNEMLQRFVETIQYNLKENNLKKDWL